MGSKGQGSSDSMAARAKLAMLMLAARARQAMPIMAARAMYHHACGLVAFYFIFQCKNYKKINKNCQITNLRAREEHMTRLQLSVA
jgi:hypothetical protein